MPDRTKRGASKAAYLLSADTPSGLAATATATSTAIATDRDGERSQTIAHYPSSVVFLLSENYEQMFPEFNFPNPTSPDDSVSRRTASWRDAYSGSTQTPFRGLDEDFGNSVWDFDSSHWRLVAIDTLCVRRTLHTKVAESAASLL